jgi:small subunit ribosomal protein S6
MPMYETMLITSTTLDEEASVAVVNRFKSLIEANGTIDAVEEWGKRRLAYPINKEEDGVYTLIHFTSEAGFPAELDRVYKITDGVLRSLIIAKDEVMEKARLENAAKAAAARAEAAKAEAARVAARAEAERAAAEKSAEAAPETPATVAEAAGEEPAAEAPAEEPAAEATAAAGTAEEAAEAGEKPAEEAPAAEEETE